MDEAQIRTAALAAALETDFHGDVNILLEAANRIQMYLTGELSFLDKLPS